MDVDEVSFVASKYVFIILLGNAYLVVGKVLWSKLLDSVSTSFSSVLAVVVFMAVWVLLLSVCIVTPAIIPLSIYECDSDNLQLLTANQISTNLFINVYLLCSTAEPVPASFNRKTISMILC